MIEKIKKALDCKNDSELAKKINRHRSQIARLRKSDFSSSTWKIVEFLLEKINHGKIKS